MTRHRRRPALVLLAAAVVLAGCTTDGGGSAASADGERMGKPTLTVPVGEEQATDPAYEAFYSQELAWEDCRDGVECATATVPVNWDDPGGDTLDLALTRVAATGDRIGSLLVNPGGPGASGADYVAEYSEYIVSPALRERYDLIGFDPRGVGASQPLDCLDDAAMDDYLAFTADPSTDEGLAELTDESEMFADACARGGGELLGELGTPSVARDLDVLRNAVGDEHLSYLGFSYGTLIGAEYARAFPQRVGRLVLDGAIDPALTSSGIALGQAAGMEGALRAYVEACLAGDSGGQCPLRGSPDEAMAQIGDVLQQAVDQPLRTADPDRPLTGTLALYGVITPLYEDAIWYQLDEALAGAVNGDGTALLALADTYADRNPDGTYASNLLEVISAVNCLDYPADDDVADLREVASELEAAAPTMGPYLAYGDVLCGAWDAEATREPSPVTADGAAPILVVGTTGDPATPYEWAEALAGELDSGRLLTYDGEGHTAYPRGGDCVIQAVDGYLVDAVLPDEGTTC